MIRITSWLLRTFGSGHSTETLIGDLTEEYTAGKSGAWLFAQALSAIPTTFIAEVRGHKLLTLRAAGVALGLLILLPVGISFLRPLITAAAEVYLPSHEPYMASTYMIVGGVRVEAGRHPLPWTMAVYGPVLQLFLAAMGAWLIGWVVRRTHHAIGTTATLATVLVSLLLAFVRSVAVAQLTSQHNVPEGVRIAETGWWHSGVASLVVMVTALLLGGLRKHRAPAQVGATP